MSIDMYLNDSLTQASSTSHFCQKQVTDYQNLQQAITQFTLQTPNLKGKAYDAAKAYFSQVLYPLVQGGILLSEAVEKATKRFPQEYIEQVDFISLKQSELEAQIRQMNQYITQAEGIRQLLLSPYMPEEHQGFQLNQNTLLLTMYHDLKQKLEEKLQKLLDYNQSSTQFFSEINSLEQAVNQGLAQTKTAWNSQTKTFSMPKDLSWTTTIQDKWQQAENEKKGIDPTKNKELEKYNVYALIISDSEGNPRVFWKIENKQSGHGIMNPELYQYVTKVGHYLDPELIQFMTYDTYQEKVNAAWRQGINYETGEKLDPLVGSLVSTSQYVKDGYTWITESELGQAMMVLGFTYASYKVLTTTGVKEVESGKIEETNGGHNFKFGNNSKNHLKNVETVNTKKGVVGGHNMDEFNNALKKQGFNPESLIISKKPHSFIDGVYEVEYKIPRKDIAGNILEPVSYKTIKQPKTIYDPAKISDEKLYRWGQEAMENGIIQSDGRTIEGIASNGLRFRGYLEEVKSTNVKNFFPILD